MNAQLKLEQTPENMMEVVGYVDRPVAFVEDVLGATPDEWQREVLNDIVANPRLAVASGHGIGKTALTSWIILWFIATHANPQIVVTANTQTQLTTKTWRELAKWNNRSLIGEWFGWTATKFSLKGEEETWFASAIPWSENNSEAFAGTHEENVLLLFDEASAIADIIWEVAEGAMTTEGAKWLAFGNPTKNSGRFHDCFGKFAHRWKTRQIDSRTAKITNKEQLSQWIEDYGEDSDFVRVRVKGQFPRVGDSQFIPTDIVIAAQERTVARRIYDNFPRVLGVDVARGGGAGDRSVILRRQGPKVWDPKMWREKDTMELVDEIVAEYRDFKPVMIMVDGTGVGTGVVHRLKQLGLPVVDVIVAQQARDKKAYANLRAELWGEMRDWLKGEVQLPQVQDLREELTTLEYGYTNRMQVQLERKQDMVKRGVASPDIADALSLTFADFVAPVRRSRPRRVINRVRNSW